MRGLNAIAPLVGELERSSHAPSRVRALTRFFRNADHKESAWLVALLLGKSRRLVPSVELARWGCEVSGTSTWLWEECFKATGSVQETAALLCARGHGSPGDLCEAFQVVSEAMREEIQGIVKDFWAHSDAEASYVLNRYISGGFRFTKASHWVSQALSDVYGVPASTIAERLLRDFQPTIKWFETIVEQPSTPSRTFPFSMATALAGSPKSLGRAENWHRSVVAWGTRCQLAKHGCSVLIWSQSDQLLNTDYPDIVTQAEQISDDFTLDGVVTTAGSFQPLDLLFLNQMDLRTNPFATRLAKLEELLEDSDFSFQERLSGQSWDAWELECEKSRSPGAEGVLLRRWDSPYGSEKPSLWWRLLRFERTSLRAVLMYAHRGESQSYTHLTFGLIHQGEVVSICKTTDGLPRRDLDELFAWIKANTLERIGPVRTVPPHQIVELTIDSVQPSSRHKCGYVVHGARMRSWMRELTIEQVDTLDILSRLANEQPRS